MQDTLEILRSFFKLSRQVNITFEVTSTSDRPLGVGIRSFTLNVYGQQLDTDSISFKARSLGFELKKQALIKNRTSATFFSSGGSISVELLHYFITIYSKKSAAKKRTQEVRDLISGLLTTGQVVPFIMPSQRLPSITASNEECLVMQLSVAEKE